MIIFCDFIARWPILTEAKKARKQTMVNFFNQHNSRYPAVNEQRVAEVKTATPPLTKDPDVIEPNKLLIEGIERLDKEIKYLYKKQDEHIIIDSFPGANA